MLFRSPSPLFYIPAGWTRDQTAPSDIAIEDFEIVRLVDGHALTIAEAAEVTGVSRSTAGRMLERARRGLALAVERRAPIVVDAGEDLVVANRPGPAARRETPSAIREAGGLAIACSSIHPSAPVERFFGRAPAFAIWKQNGGRPRRVANPGARAGRNAAPEAVAVLRKHRVRCVLAGRFGPEAIHHLADAGIRARVATGMTLEEALSQPFG